MFVLPEYHGIGIGKLTINTLEEDEFYKSASRIEIPTSITAVPFYQKFDYKFKMESFLVMRTTKMIKN
ncbi:GNAT family N-acetyltransferase [Staphylococcus sp. GDY8P45P]|uniref:GNAT family N-acetyltransferase n=1 Tax=Staphylococcus sp. GDY8P45P TaxID=2804120 RepID=UPI0032AE910C